METAYLTVSVLITVYLPTWLNIMSADMFNGKVYSLSK